MACPKDSAFASQLPVLDLTEMNTLLQLSYVAQQCLYTGETEPQEPNDGYSMDLGESHMGKDPMPTDIISWMPYEDHNYARPPPPLSQPNSSTSSSDQMDIDDVSCHTTVTTTVTESCQESWEGSVTRCICEFKHDDGYMICCDRCGVWQHVECMGVERANIPDVYLCELCEPRFVDKHNAIRLQTRKRELLQKMGNLTDDDSDDNSDRRRSPKKSIGRKKQERRRTVSTSTSRGQKPGRVPGNQMEPTTTPATINPKTIFPNRRNSTRTSKAAETVTRQPSPIALVSPVARFAPTLEGPSNVYSQELLGYLAEHQRANGLERASTTARWNGPPTGEACSVFQVTPQIKGIKASRVIEANEAIIEYTGNVMLRHEFQPDWSESTVLFYSNVDSRLDVCVNATTDDGVARFVRRSCMPNAVVKHIFDGRGEVHFCICSSVVIGSASEITIPFDCDVKAGDTDVTCACGLTSCLLLFQNSSSPRKPRHVRKSVGESDKVASAVPVKILPSSSPPGVRGRRRRHSTSFHSPPKKDVRTGPDVGLPLSSSSPAKVEEIQRCDHHVRSERMGRGRWNRTRSMNQSSSQEPQKPSSDCGGVTENNDANRKLTREEKKLEAIMKAFEQIQKEGPKRPRDSHPEKRSRKRSAKSESTESKEVMSESTSKVVTLEWPESKAVMSELIESKAVKSESTVSRAVMSESQTVKSELTESKAETSELKAEMLESKTIEFKDKGPDEEPALPVKKEHLSGSVVDDNKDVEKPTENDEERENCEMLLNLMDATKKCGLTYENTREKTEMKWKDEEVDKGGEWTGQMEDNGVIGKSPLIVENVVKDEAGEKKKVEFEGVQDEHGDLGNSEWECETAVKMEKEEIPPMEDVKSEHAPVESTERPSTVAATSPQKTGKHSEVVVAKSKQLSTAEPEDHVTMETDDSPARSDVCDKTPNLERAKEDEPKDDATLPLRRSKRRQPSGASQPELPPQTKDSETIVKEPSLETIPIVPIAEENIEAPKEADAVVKPVARSKGRPRKVVKDGEKVVGKESEEKKVEEKKVEEKKVVEVRFEHRVRTRSCTKETNSGGVATSKTKPRGRKCNPNLKKKVQAEQQQRQSSASRLAFSKTHKKILPCRKSGRSRPNTVRVAPPQSTTVTPPNVSTSGEPTTRVVHLMTSPDRSSALLRAHKLLLSEARAAKALADNPECTSSESDLDWTRGGMLSPSAEALVTPVGSGASLNSSSNNPASPWSQLDASLSHGSAKKRWLRQAINESVEPAQSSPVEPVASSSGSTETPLSPSTGFTTPLKKRRLTIESDGTSGFHAASKLTWSDEGRSSSEFFVQSPPEPRREIADLPFNSQSIISTQQIQPKDSETCKVTIDFDRSSKISDSLLTIKCPSSQLQPPDTETTVKITNQSINLNEQHTSHSTKPVEPSSKEFDKEHTEPSSSDSYSGENLKEFHDFYDVNCTINCNIETLPTNTKTRWLTNADKSSNLSRNSFSVQSNNLAVNNFSPAETSDPGSLESVAKGDHQQRGSQSACGKQSSGEYEVSTTDASERETNKETKSDSKWPLSADDRVTCSSVDADGEPVSLEKPSRMEKEEGEITDDEPSVVSAPCCVDGTPSGVTSSEISSTNFRWSHPYPPGYRGGRGWGGRGNPCRGGVPCRPFRFRGRDQRGSCWQREPLPSSPKQPGISELKSHRNSCSPENREFKGGMSCSPEQAFKGGCGKPCSPDRNLKGRGALCSPNRDSKGKSCSPPDSEESHVDSSSAVSSGPLWKKKSQELVVGSPITSDDDDDVGGNDSIHSNHSPLSRESEEATTRFLARPRSPVVPWESDEKMEEKMDEKMVEKKEKELSSLRRRSSSTSSSFSSSSSDFEQRRSNQQGTKKKMSLMEYRKRMKHRRKSAVVVMAESTSSKASSLRRIPDVQVFQMQDGGFEAARREIANAIQKLSSVSMATAVSSVNNRTPPPPPPPTTQVAFKSLSLTERLRYEFGVDASDETDGQQDDDDDDSPPPPPPPPPPPRPPPVPLPYFRPPHLSTHRPPLPPSPEPPPPPPPADTPPPPPPPPSNPPRRQKLHDRLVQGHGVLLSSLSPNLSTSSAWNDSTPTTPGMHSPVVEHALPRMQQQHGRVPGVKPRGPTTGVKVEYFASVRSQTPRPITPGAVRLSSKSPVVVPSPHAETSPAPVYGHDAGPGVQLGRTTRIHPVDSFVPIRVPDLSCSKNTPRPGAQPTRTNHGQNLPHPSIPQHPRQPNVHLPGMDCALPPHRGALPHSRPPGPPPPPGEVISSGLDMVRSHHPHAAFTETRDVFPGTQVVLPPGDHDHEQIHVEDYHPDNDRRYHGFRPSSSATEEAEFDERQNWLPQGSWSKSSWVDAEANGGRLGDEEDNQTTTPRKVMPLMSIRSFPTRQFPDETMTSPQAGPSPQSKRFHQNNWPASESWHDTTQSDRASDANLTPSSSSANSESTNHDSLPMSAHDRAKDFADNGLDCETENGDRGTRTGGRSSTRSDFIRSSLERNRACQAILRKQMSDSL